jgi:hypothetical protein
VTNRSLTRARVNRALAAGLGMSTVLVLGGILWVGRVEAGYKFTAPVFIDAAARYASGSFGAARNSGDANQQISCSATASGLNHSVMCFANNSVGENAVCYADDNPALEGIDLAGLTIMTESSYIEFSWDEQGNCISISVLNYSSLEPKRP